MIVLVKTCPYPVQRRSHRHPLQMKTNPLEDCSVTFVLTLCPIINPTVSRVKATSEDTCGGFILQGSKYTIAKITMPASTKTRAEAMSGTTKGNVMENGGEGGKIHKIEVE